MPRYPTVEHYLSTGVHSEVPAPRIQEETLQIRDPYSFSRRPASPYIPPITPYVDFVDGDPMSSPLSWAMSVTPTPYRLSSEEVSASKSDFLREVIFQSSGLLMVL
jgi:hypothetical protein